MASSAGLGVTWKLQGWIRNRSIFKEPPSVGDNKHKKIRHKLVSEMVGMCEGSGGKKREPLTYLGIGVHTLKEGVLSRVLKDAWGVVSKQGGKV